MGGAREAGRHGNSGVEEALSERCGQELSVKVGGVSSGIIGGV